MSGLVSGDPLCMAGVVALGAVDAGEEYASLGLEASGRLMDRASRFADPATASSLAPWSAAARDFAGDDGVFSSGDKPFVPGGKLT